MFDKSDADRRCGKCDEKLRDSVVVACGRLWHPHHFTCATCEVPLKDVFREKDTQHYCSTCFDEKFNPRCAGCSEVLHKTCIEAMGKHWHEVCFTCTACRQPFPHGQYYVIDAEPYDLDCHWGRRLDKYEQVQRQLKQD